MRSRAKRSAFGKALFLLLNKSSFVFSAPLAHCDQWMLPLAVYVRGGCGWLAEPCVLSESFTFILLKNGAYCSKKIRQHLCICSRTFFCPVYHFGWINRLIVALKFVSICVLFLPCIPLTEANGSAKRPLYPSASKINLPSIPLCCVLPDAVYCSACEPNIVE